MAAAKENLRDRPAGGGKDPGAAASQSAKDVFVALSRAVSAFKLFPDQNETVVRFREEFTSRLQSFLASNGELEVEVRQSAFHYQSRPVWQDENVIHSLPYLFFKDGLRTLTLLPGITAGEIAEFLTVIKTVSLQPLETGDIVDALWQKDFAGIQYYASDEFLESKIAVDHKIPTPFHVRKEDLFQGRLDLRPEDGAEVLKVMRERGGEGGPPPADPADQYAPLDAADLKRLDVLLVGERRAYEEKDFMDLVFELLQVEERPEAFADILTYLSGHHGVQVQSLDFTSAIRLLKMREPLARKLADAGPVRLRAFEKFRADLGMNCPWSEVRAAAGEGRIPDPGRLFEYLALWGPASLALGADIYEDAQDREWRALAQAYFEKLGKRDPPALARQVQEDHPAAAKAILGILGAVRDPRTIPVLEACLAFQDKSIRLKAIRALGGFPDEEAQRILVELLQDPDREARIEAASQVRIGGVPEKIRELISMTRDRNFERKSEAETSAFLLALGHCGSEEAGAALAALLKRRAIFARSRLMAVQLGAVRALEAHGGTAAAEALAACARGGPRGLRSACREARDRLAAKPVADRNVTS
jgi:hypothetical protein